MSSCLRVSLSRCLNTAGQEAHPSKRNQFFIHARRIIWPLLHFLRPLKTSLPAAPTQKQESAVPLSRRASERAQPAAGPAGCLAGEGACPPVNHPRLTPNKPRPLLIFEYLPIFPRTKARPNDKNKMRHSPCTTSSNNEAANNGERHIVERGTPIH
jgi:hypothetical protein